MTIASPLGFQVIAVPTQAPPKPSRLRRVFEAVFASREREAQREIDAYVARRGHRMTDSVEREIGERMIASQWGPRR